MMLGQRWSGSFESPWESKNKLLFFPVLSIVWEYSLCLQMFFAIEVFPSIGSLTLRFSKHWFDLLAFRFFYNIDFSCIEVCLHIIVLFGKWKFLIGGLMTPWSSFVYVKEELEIMQKFSVVIWSCTWRKQEVHTKDSWLFHARCIHNQMATMMLPGISMLSTHSQILPFFCGRSQTCFVAWINFGYCFFALIKTNSCWMNHSHILPSFFSSFCSGLKTMGLLLATRVKDGHKINRSCVLLHFPVKNFHQLWVWLMMHSSDSLWATYLKRKF